MQNVASEGLKFSWDAQPLGPSLATDLRRLWRNLFSLKRWIMFRVEFCKIHISGDFFHFFKDVFWAFSWFIIFENYSFCNFSFLDTLYFFHLLMFLYWRFFHFVAILFNVWIFVAFSLIFTQKYFVRVFCLLFIGLWSVKWPWR